MLSVEEIRLDVTRLLTDNSHEMSSLIFPEK